MSDRVAVIRLRGVINVNADVRDTLTMLHLHRKHYCSVWPETKTLRGMLQKAKDFVAYGTIDDDTYKLLAEKRGEKGVDGKLKGFFRLSPPKGGFEKRGIKTSFQNKGALGDRKEAMNALIKRMI